MEWSPFPWIRFSSEFVPDLLEGVKKRLKKTDLWDIKSVDDQYWVTTRSLPIQNRTCHFTWVMYHRMINPEWVLKQNENYLNTWNYAKIHVSKSRSRWWYNNTVPEGCSPILVYPDRVVIDDVLWFLMREAGYV